MPLLSPQILPFMPHAYHPLSSMRTFGAIGAGTAVALASLYAAFAFVVLVSEPVASAPWYLRAFAFVLPHLGALGLLYFAAALFAARRAPQPRSALMIGAGVTGVACALWFNVGALAESVAEVLLVALGSAVMLSVSLALGSEVLYHVGVRGRGASEA